MSCVSQCQGSIWAVPCVSALLSAMYDVCAQPGDWTMNAQAHAKTASAGSKRLRRAGAMARASPVRMLLTHSRIRSA